MKSTMLALTLCLMSLPLIAQTSTPSPDQIALQQAKVQLALKDYQLAQAQANQAQQNIAVARQNVLGAVAEAKKRLGYGDDWDFNYDQGVFVKKTPVPTTPPVKK